MISPDALVSMGRVIAERAGTNWDNIGEFSQQVIMDTQRAALEASEIDVAVAQAIEFAQYVVDAAKGKMSERAAHFLSLHYSKQLAVRLKCTLSKEEIETVLGWWNDTIGNTSTLSWEGDIPVADRLNNMLIALEAK